MELEIKLDKYIKSIVNFPKMIISTKQKIMRFYLEVQVSDY